MTEIFPLEGRALKWDLAYFGPRVGYFGHIFWDISFKFVLPIIYIKIDGQTNLKSIGLNFAINKAYETLQKPLKWPYRKMDILKN